MFSPWTAVCCRFGERTYMNRCSLTNQSVDEICTMIFSGRWKTLSVISLNHRYN